MTTKLVISHEWIQTLCTPLLYSSYCFFCKGGMVSWDAGRASREKYIPPRIFGKFSKSLRIWSFESLKKLRWGGQKKSGKMWIKMKNHPKDEKNWVVFRVGTCWDEVGMVRHPWDAVWPEAKKTHTITRVAKLQLSIESNTNRLWTWSKLPTAQQRTSKYSKSWLITVQMVIMEILVTVCIVFQ